MSDAEPDAKAIFFAALEQPGPDALGEFLEVECGSDAALRARVEDLLRAHQMAGNFLGGSMACEETVDRPPITEQPGTQIGPYKLLQQIGEGGFGVVFMAEQREPINRRVALKVIKRGMDTREVIARFEAERQALAMMDHPNIAKVLDAGSTDRGRPYFVMELVKGISLTTFCDEQTLPTQQRLEIFHDICAAVNHAHQKGIIHRDLKPSNILVTLHGDLPVPKIIDFGIAKATQQQLTDKTLFTRFEQFIGTPVYMSPEQAALSGLDIDTRADLYSLGVLLYELLTGKPPFDSRTLRSAGYDEMRRIILEEDPPKPSTRIASLAVEERSSVSASRQSDPKRLSGQVRGELDWIVMKAIEKDRTRRYATANEFALDIRCYLNGDPVTAAAPTSTYRLRKFACRHKTPLGVAAAVALSLVVGAAVTTWQAFRAEREAARKVETLAQLRAAAPAFLLQAEDLVQLGRPIEAIEKIDHALALQPGATDFLLRKAQLLHISDAVENYSAILSYDPDHEEAQRWLTVCDEVLDHDRNGNGVLSTQALATLRLSMVDAGRPASELSTVSKRFEEQSQQLKESWLERLRDLPVEGGKSLDKRLVVNNRVGRLMLDLSGTDVTDLSPLKQMPLGLLILAGCRGVDDLAPLAGLPLRTLILADTAVRDLEPLRKFSHLVSLNFDRTGIRDLSALQGLSLTRLSLSQCAAVRDLTPLRGMPLERLTICGTSVSSFEPLKGMPITSLHACRVPATDVDHLAGLPLETLLLTGHKVSDLGFVERLPLAMLSIAGCEGARNYRALTRVSTLQNLTLPSNLTSLPAEEQSALDTLVDERSPLRQVTDWRFSAAGYAAVERKESFARRWQSIRRLVQLLDREGLEYKLSRHNKTAFDLHIKTPSFDDLSLLKDARLEGVRLHRLNVHGTAIRDLSPLHDLRITELIAYNTRVEDLGPLRAMNSLKRLELAHTPVHDIGPLRELPLEKLTIDGTKVTDVSPLTGMSSLRTLMLPVAVADLNPVRNLNLAWTSFWWDFQNSRPVHRADEFWQLGPEKLLHVGQELIRQDWEQCRDYFSDLSSRILQEREADAGSALLLLQASVVLALCADPETHHELCGRIVTRFENCGDARALERSGKAILLVEPSDRNLRERACGMLRECYELRPAGDPWFHLSRALAEHRCGDPFEVTKYLGLIKSDDARITAAAAALEAMARRRTDDPDAARLALAEAEQLLTDMMGEFARRVKHNDGWHDVLICRLLAEEAARLMNDTKYEEKQRLGAD